jgi:hypothetical protein
MQNVASLRLAQAVGAIEVETFVNEHGRATVRHIVNLHDLAGGL